MILHDKACQRPCSALAKPGASRTEEASGSGETSREEMTRYVKDVTAPMGTRKHSLTVQKMKWRLCRIREQREVQKVTEGMGVGGWAASLVDFLRRGAQRGRDAGQGKGSCSGPSRAPCFSSTHSQQKGKIFS